MHKQNILSRIFEWLSELINGMELSFLNLLSAVVPYAVPVIPAYLTFYHTKSEMGFPEWVAWTAAFVTEVLGITSVATAIKFYRHNSLYKDPRNKAPFWLAVLTYVFYIVVVLSVNVILEVVAHTRSSAVIWAIGLFSLLSFPSAVLISIRSQFREMLDERRLGRSQNVQNQGTVVRGRSMNRDGGSSGSLEPSTGFSAKLSGSIHPREHSERTMGFAGMFQRNRTKHASDYKNQILKMLDETWAAKRTVLGPTAIARKLRLDPRSSKGYIHGLIQEWKKSRGI